MYLRRVALPPGLLLFLPRAARFLAGLNLGDRGWRSSRRRFRNAVSRSLLLARGDGQPSGDGHNGVGCGVSVTFGRVGGEQLRGTTPTQHVASVGGM